MSDAGASSSQTPVDGLGKPEKGKKTKSANPFQRRRARRACVACHERKVRCDVLQRQPCTNCEQDRCKCVVRPHKNRRASVAAMELANQPDGQDFESSQGGDMSELSPIGDGRHLSNASTTLLQHRPGPPHMMDPNMQSLHPFSQDAMAQAMANENPWFNQNTHMYLPQTTTNLDFFDPFGSQPQYFNFDPLLGADTTALTGLESVFSAQPAFATEPQPNQMFNTNTNPMYTQPSPATSLSTTDILQLPTTFSDEFMDLTHAPAIKRCFGDSASINTDREYLRSQGCFQLPSVPVFYEMMKGYFKFVHPNLPVIDERDFWGLWSEDGSEFRIGDWSVLVLQAMGFAATSFVDADLLSHSGFQDARKARITFHKRAKLLFDMEIETSPIAMSQSALLLTYYATTTSKLRVNSLWLTYAIRYAQQAQADRFYEVSQEQDPRRRSMLKRLWWGCVVRDRILPLGLRRPTQIRENLPIPGDGRFIDETDFSFEIGASRVHDAASQRRIALVCNLTCRLAEVLTPAMVTLFTAEKPRERAISTPATLQRSLGMVRQHIDHLHGWHEMAIRHFPPPVGLGDECDTVVIYANLLFIYYDAAIMALCHHAFMLWETRSSTSTNPGNSSTTPNNNNTNNSTNTNNNKSNPRTPTNELNLNLSPAAGISRTTEIFHAISSTTDRVRELLQMRLAQHLPISVSAYLCFPLLLTALNVKAAQTDAEAAVARRQLTVYTKVLEMQQKLYDGTDYVFGIIENITRYADEERLGLLLESSSENNTTDGGEPADKSSGTSESVTPNGSGVGGGGGGGGGGMHRRPARVPSAWRGLLLRKPRLYLRLVLHLDVAFCEGTPPQEHDFPVELRRA